MLLMLHDIYFTFMRGSKQIISQLYKSMKALAILERESTRNTYSKTKYIISNRNLDSLKP